MRIHSKGNRCRYAIKEADALNGKIYITKS